MTMLDFLHFNKYCPLCNEPLTLYMQWVDGPCWKAHQIEEHTYRFDQFACRNLGLEKADLNNEYLDLRVYGDAHYWDYKLDFSVPGLQQQAKRFETYFFYLCNPAAFKMTRNGKSYDLVPYRGCYHRSTTMLELKEKDGAWKYQPINQEKPELWCREETFTFKRQLEDLEKVYILTVDVEEQKTKMWYYTITEEQKKTGGPKSKVFEKFLPLMNKRPNIQDKQAMMDRLDSWIMIS